MAQDKRHPVEPPPNAWWDITLYGHPDELCDAQDYIESECRAYEPIFSSTEDGSMTVRMRWNSKVVERIITDQLGGLVNKIHIKRKVEE